ncbi:MAG: transcription/translation regulatory transformer protein RfaH [Thermodesulfovibrionales bacterium]
MTGWYALYVKPGHEGSVASLLSRAGFEVLDPKIRLRKPLKGKYRDVVEPLFPCYIFARFDAEEHLRTMKFTRGVRYVVGKDVPKKVPEELVAAIAGRLENGIMVPRQEVFSAGDRVVIRDGPFANLIGVFERRISGKERAMVLLDVLNCRIDIDAVALRKME